MKKKLIIDSIGLILTVVAFLFLASCSPQKRLNRLIKNNPELAKTDTIYSTKTFTVPGYKLDTTFKASENVNGLNELVNVYREYLDSVKRQKLTADIKTFIVERKCLDDTFKVSLNNNGYCKFWQSKTTFHYQLYQPKQKISFNVPVAVNNIKATITNDWKMFFIGMATALGGIVLLVIVLYFIKMYIKPI